MTTIVGIEHEGNVWIGGDSAVMLGDTELNTQVGGKVFRLGDVIFGVAGWTRTSAMLRYDLRLPERRFDQPGQTDIGWLNTDFTRAVHECLERNGWDPQGGSRPQRRSSDNTIMVGYRGKLYVLRDNFEVSRYPDHFYAIGVGGEIAIGYLAATKERGPRDRILGALATAARYSVGTRDPFTILCGLGREPWKDETLDIDPWREEPKPQACPHHAVDYGPFSNRILAYPIKCRACGLEGSEDRTERRHWPEGSSST